ncbi:hypothetical protein AAII07_54800 [Microvirga sp. 0TCS3.31]
MMPLSPAAIGSPPVFQEAQSGERSDGAGDVVDRGVDSQAAIGRLRLLSNRLLPDGAEAEASGQGLSVPTFAKNISGFRDGIGHQPSAFDDHTSSLEKQDRSMHHLQASGPLQDTTLDLTSLTNTGPSLHRAAILFVASVSSFIGASLLLASI